MDKKYLDLMDIKAYRIAFDSDLKIKKKRTQYRIVHTLQT